MIQVDKWEALSYKIKTRITRMAAKKPGKPDIAAEEKLDSILHPSTTAKTFKITLEFGHKISPNYEKAVGLARRNPTYRQDGEGEWVRHSATYAPQDVEELFRLFTLIHEWENTEVLVNHKRIPYGHQLWLPLMWFHRVK
jgi:hypothetical protein